MKLIIFAGLSKKWEKVVLLVEIMERIFNRKHAVAIVLLGLGAMLLMPGCESREFEMAWQQSLYRIGTQSSPRATDLNGDGVLDIVIGAGKNEYQETPYGVLAMDGTSGELLWKMDTNDQLFGSRSAFLLRCWC